MTKSCSLLNMIKESSTFLPKKAPQRDIESFQGKAKERRGKKREPRSKLNEWAKFLVSQANFIFTIFGFFIVGAASYLLGADFGDLDKTFFVSGGIIFFLFGWIVRYIIFGLSGIYYQRRVSPYTKWQGTRILMFYQVFLILTFAAELVWLAVSMNAITALKENASKVLNGETPTYTSLEAKFAEKFDAFFFGAQSECGSLRYAWFWSFINKRCTKFNSNMSQLLCQRCDDYSVTMCDPDVDLCYNSELTSAYNFACPYNACREGVLEFVIDRLSPFAYFTIFLVVFQILLIASTCALICFHPRDSDAEIRAKNGIFAKGESGGMGGTAMAKQAHSGPIDSQPMAAHARHMPNSPPPPPVHMGAGSKGLLNGGNYATHSRSGGAPRGMPGSHAAPPPRPPPGMKETSKSRPNSVTSPSKSRPVSVARRTTPRLQGPRGPKRK